MNDLFEKKITIMVLSVVLSIMLWFYVVTDQNPVITKDLSLPIRLENLDSLTLNNLVLLDDELFSASIRLKGNKNYLDSLNRTTVFARVDLRSVSTKGLVDMPVDLSGIPVGVEVSWISSNKLTLNIDNIVSEIMPISLNIVGNTLMGTAAMKSSIDPAEVTITGPETIVGTVKKAEVTVDISNSDKEINRDVDVIALDAEGQTITGLDINPKHINVTIPIENTKSVTIDPDYRIVAADGYMITNILLEPRTVNIVGNKEVLDGITRIVTERIEAFDVKESIEHKVKLILPPNVELVSKGENIVFTAIIEKIEEKLIELDTIVFKDLAEDLKAEIFPNSLKIIIRGTQSHISGWDIANAFYIDLKNLEEGSYNLPVLFTKPEQIELREINPVEVKVTIKKKD